MIDYSKKITLTRFSTSQSTYVRSKRRIKSRFKKNHQSSLKRQPELSTIFPTPSKGAGRNVTSTSKVSDGPLTVSRLIPLIRTHRREC